MLSPAALADRDGPRCWLCGNDVDPRAPAGSREAGSVDHVVPRAKGGGNEDDNLRLAHRVCNSRRGSRLPELDWPEELAAVDAAPLWPAVQRALRRPGEWELVGLLPTRDSAERAHDWLRSTLPLVLGGSWEVAAAPSGAADLHTVRLRAAPPESRPRHRGRRRG